MSLKSPSGTLLSDVQFRKRLAKVAEAARTPTNAVGSMVSIEEQPLNSEVKVLAVVLFTPGELNNCAGTLFSDVQFWKQKP